jgi:two-component sensor histidine kinase
MSDERIYRSPAQLRAEITEQARQAINHELHHRVKNMLATAMAITSQTLARASSVAEGRMAAEQRLMALAEAHNLLRDGPDAAGLRTLVERAIAPYDTTPGRFGVAGDDLALSAHAALALAMAVHELCTNAVKHGALAEEAGRVAIAWHAEESRLRWTWRETGRPSAQAPARRGFGLRVIEASFRDQLGGSVTISFAPSGFVCAAEVPLAALRGGAS